eukprot:gb/GEZN01019680.1/.p1 GENE.gb/GEZN01019680.1/~~gb/GEZN01019680.1/.p1  ORF type:complete len:209 (-),score=39.95 gb/GEZN01019680.1/:86-643(-)
MFGCLYVVDMETQLACLLPHQASPPPVPSSFQEDLLQLHVYQLRACLSLLPLAAELSTTEQAAPSTILEKEKASDSHKHEGEEEQEVIWRYDLPSHTSWFFNQEEVKAEAPVLSHSEGDTHADVSDRIEEAEAEAALPCATPADCLPNQYKSPTATWKVKEREGASRAEMPTECLQFFRTVNKGG